MKDKRAKFIELATNRVNRVINDLRLIGNLSNRSAYEYADEDIKKITRTIQRELDLMRSRFDGRGRGGDNNFTL
jgi:transcription elongation GreA/GreB family factor